MELIERQELVKTIKASNIAFKVVGFDDFGQTDQVAKKTGGGQSANKQYQTENAHLY